MSAGGLAACCSVSDAGTLRDPQLWFSQRLPAIKASGAGPASLDIGHD